MKKENKIIHIGIKKELCDRLNLVFKYIKKNTEFTTQKSIAEKINFTRSNFSAALNGDERFLTEGLVNRVVNAFPKINKDWLLTGKGKMLNEEITKKKSPSEKYIEEEKRKAKESNLIPMYDDVSTFGSTNQNADLTAVSTPTEYIDAGTWFGNTKITAAIRHYGDSMVEYPNGCILALKEIRDRQNIIPGRNYVIETDEIRVTKRVQLCNDDNFFTAYSSNNETYPDGRQIHEPFKIKKKKINRVFLVVGRIVKEHSSGAVTILD